MKKSLQTKLSGLWLVVLLAGSISSWGQIALPNTNAATQNFNSMNATSQSASLPANWKFSSAGNANPTWEGSTLTATTQIMNPGTENSAGGRYNYGSTTSSDRAVGFQSSGSYGSPNSIMAQYRNTNTLNLNKLTVSYSIERYRRNTAAASIQFFYSLDGTAWTAVTAGDVPASSLPTDTSLYGYPQLTVNVSAFEVTGLNIAPNTNFYLRWNFNTTGTNSQSLGLDNVSVTPAFAPALSPTVMTGSATLVMAASASLNGMVTPNGNTINSRFFQFGTTTSYGQTAAFQTENTGANTFAASVNSLSSNTQYHYRAGVTYTGSANAVYGDDVTFTTLANVPGIVALSNATGTTVNVSVDAATQNGNNTATVYSIQEITTGLYVQANGGDLAATEVFQAASAWLNKTVTGLSYNTTYKFHARARNSASIVTAYGPESSVTTQTNTTPAVTTNIAIDNEINSVQGIIRAVASPNTQTVNLRFEYGLTASYGNEQAGQTASLATFASGTSDVPFSRLLTGLQPSTTYHYRAVLRNPDSNEVVAVGQDRTFTTKAYVQSAPIAGTGTEVTDLSFVANWSTIPDASEYRLDVSTTPEFTAGTFITDYNNRLVAATFETVQGPEITQNKTFYYRVRAVNNTYGATSVNSNTVTVTTTNPFVWNGTAWSREGQPELTDDVYIKGNFTTVDDLPGTGDINEQPVLKAKSLRISNGSFIVSPFTNVLVENEVVVLEPGTLTIESNGSLSQNMAMAPNQGVVKVKRFNYGLYRLDYSLWSSPVSGQNLLDFSPKTVINRFYKYDTAQNLYVSSQHVAFNPAAEDFQPGVGYLIRMPDTDETPGYAAGNGIVFYPGEFDGALNNGDINVNVSDAGSGFNAVGNPYASSIDADQFLLTNAQGADPVIGNTLYFWRKRNAVEGDFYATYTPLGGTRATGTTTQGEVLSTEVPNGSIQTGQGFIVKVLPGKAGNRTMFTNGMREIKNTGQIFRTGNTTVEKHRMWFNFTSPEGLVYNSLVGYMDGAVNGADFTDGNRFNTANDGFYSVIDGGQYAIQGRTLPFDVQDEVVMGYKANKPGSYTISLDKTDGMFLQEMPIFIKDNVTGTLHNIKDGAYTFATEAGTFNDRFTIVYADAPAMNVNDNALTANNVVVYKQGTTLTINTGKVNMSDVTIFDIQGRAIYNATDVNAGELVITDLQSQQQVLLVQVSTPQGRVSKKVIF